MKTANIGETHLIQAPGQSTSECIANLLNNLRSGNLDLNALQEGISKCFGLNPNNNGGNNTPKVPQVPSTNTPRFV